MNVFQAVRFKRGCTLKSLKNSIPEEIFNSTHPKIANYTEGEPNEIFDLTNKLLDALDEFDTEAITKAKKELEVAFCYLS